jgi:hypothetical protein
VAEDSQYRLLAVSRPRRTPRTRAPTIPTLSSLRGALWPVPPQKLFFEAAYRRPS